MKHLSSGNFLFEYPPAVVLGREGLSFDTAAGLLAIVQQPVVQAWRDPFNNESIKFGVEGSAFDRVSEMWDFQFSTGVF